MSEALGEALERIADDAERCVPNQYYIHERADTTYADIVSVCRLAAAALASLSHAEPAVPDGWQLVPKKCTPEMSAAFWEAERGFTSGWKAALEAAPSASGAPPADEVGETIRDMAKTIDLNAPIEGPVALEVPHAAEGEMVEEVALALLRRTTEYYGDPMPANPDLLLTKELARAAIAAIREERERCAKIAEIAECDGRSEYIEACEDIAAAIRKGDG